MKIKIGEIVYDDSEHAIMLILTNQDKRNINRMPQGNMRYISHPGELTAEVKAWAEAPIAETK